MGGPVGVVGSASILSGFKGKKVLPQSIGNLHHIGNVLGISENAVRNGRETLADIGIVGGAEPRRFLLCLFVCLNNRGMERPPVVVTGELEGFSVGGNGHSIGIGLLAIVKFDELDELIHA